MVIENFEDFKELIEVVEDLKELIEVFEESDVLKICVKDFMIINIVLFNGSILEVIKV